MLRGQFRVTVLSPGETESEAPPPATFPLADAILTRQDLSEQPVSKRGDLKGETIEETLTGRLDDKPFAIETHYATFIVEGDPPLSNRMDSDRSAGAIAADDTNRIDGKENKPNPLGLKVEGRNEFTQLPAKGLTQFHLRAIKDEIIFFDVRSLLRQIALSLPNTARRNDGLTEDTRVWSRLDFNGTEIAFRLPLPESKEQIWPSARGIVTIGERPRRDICHVVPVYAGSKKGC
jgi:hypothetical protein